MFHGIVATGLEDVIEAYHVALDIGIGVLDAITDACLGCEVDHDIELILGKERIDGGFVGDIAFYKVERGKRRVERG